MTTALVLLSLLLLGFGALLWFHRDNRKHRHMQPVVAPLPLSWSPPTDLGPDFDRGVHEAQDAELEQGWPS